MTEIQGCTRCKKAEPDLNLSKYGDEWLCDSCKAIEYPPAQVMCFMRCGRIVTSPVELTKKQPRCNECAELATKQQAQMRIEMMNNSLIKVESLDATINVRTDIFNAETLAIVDIEKMINEDASIQNKPYAIAEAVKSRFESRRNLIFELQEKVNEANTQQQAIQTYLNNMANTLRAEERAKLRISDMNYQPPAVKPAAVKRITTGQSGNKKKFTNKQIAEAAKELGIGEFTLKAFVLANQGDLDTAVDKIRKSIAAAKAQTAAEKAN